MTIEKTKSNTNSKNVSNTSKNKKKIILKPIPKPKVIIVDPVVEPVEPTPQLTLQEIAQLEEPLPSKNPGEKRGKKSSGRFISYQEASEFCRSQFISSRVQYLEWFERHKPKDMPKYPHRVWKEWEGWNKFLGTNNTFGAQNLSKHRSYEDAMKYVHTLGITSFNKWLEYVRSGRLPDDIPSRPDLNYSKWRSWPHWLGSRLPEAIEAKQLIEKTQIYYIIREQGMPENVLTFGIDSGGISNFKDRWDHEQFDIVRMFWYSSKQEQFVNNVVRQLSRPYLGDEYRRIVPNFWEIVYYLETQLDRANINQARQTLQEHKRPQQIEHSSYNTTSKILEYQNEQAEIEADLLEESWENEIKPIPI